MCVEKNNEAQGVTMSGDSGVVEVHTNNAAGSDVCDNSRSDVCDNTELIPSGNLA
jgi:hypothetical protein